MRYSSSVNTKLKRISLRHTSNGNEGEENKSSLDTSSTKAYTILKSLSGYKLGEPLRNEDSILCSCESTLAAVRKIRPNDCGFILRSDGTYKYSLFDGFKDDGSLQFQVEQGKYKVVPVANIAEFIKIPMLPVSSSARRSSIRLSTSGRVVSKRRTSVSKKSSLPTVRQTKDKKKMNKKGKKQVPQLEPKSHEGLIYCRGREVMYKGSNGVVRKIYQKDSSVLYKGRDGEEEALILDVHLDDEMEPYYTIRLIDGREIRQTDNDHIVMEKLKSSRIIRCKVNINLSTILPLQYTLFYTKLSTGIERGQPLRQYPDSSSSYYLMRPARQTQHGRSH